GVVALAVPLAELAVASAWFLGLGRRPVAFAAGAMLLVFTVAYVLQLTLGQAPECHCFGEWLKFESAQRAARFIVTRNAGLMILLALGLVCEPRGGSTAGSDPGRRDGKGADHAA